MSWSNYYISILKWYGCSSKFTLSKYSLPPLHIFYLCTNKCNLNCNFCYAKELRNKKFAPSFVTHKILIDRIPKFSLLTFSGGEPLMMPCFEEVLRYTLKKHRVSLITNGTLITDIIANKLIKWSVSHIWNKGLLAIDVSLHGIGNIHDKIVAVSGAFEKTVMGIEKLIYFKKKNNKKFPLISLRCVINYQNKNILDELLKFSQKLGVDTVNITLPAPYYSFSNIYNYPYKGIAPPKLNYKKRNKKIWFTPSNIPIEELVKCWKGKFEPENYLCIFPWTRAVILFDGEFFICLSAYRSYSVGNLFKTDFKKLWNGKKAQLLRASIKRQGVLEKCLGCCGLLFKNRLKKK